jgi:hypothetical protein
MQTDPQRDCLYLGDRAYGRYRVVQIAHATGQHVLVRLTTRTARKYQRLLHVQASAGESWERAWTWEAEKGVAREPEPRAVRRPPQVFKALKGPRSEARKQLLAPVPEAVPRVLNS